MSLLKKQTFMQMAAVALLVLPATSCKVQKNQNNQAYQAPSFYNVGHRGARGLAPENTVIGMQAGLHAGANVLEFDLQPTKDGKIMLSHDKSISPDYVLHADGSAVDPAERKKYTFYQMSYADVKKFIVGKKHFAAYPEQKLQATYIPLASEIVAEMEEYARKNNFAPPVYMPEIKSDAKGAGVDQPESRVFAAQVMKAFAPFLKQISNRLIIQCYDKEVLRYIHENYPAIQLALLSKTKLPSIDEQIKELGFKPAFYLPEHRLVTKEMVAECKAKDLKIVPWTANEKADMTKLIDLGVNGIITDYPDRLKQLGK